MTKDKERGEEGFDQITRFLRDEQFPQILWIEVRRMKKAYLDSQEFMIARMEKWFRYTPSYKSQARQRSLLAKSMMQPFLPLFKQFATTMSDYSDTMLFMEIWTSQNTNELFSAKPWSMEGVDRESFDKAFNPTVENLHDSISHLREAYFSIAAKSPAPLGTGPVASALRQLVSVAEVI